MFVCMLSVCRPLARNLFEGILPSAGLPPLSLSFCSPLPSKSVQKSFPYILNRNNEGQTFEMENTQLYFIPHIPTHGLQVHKECQEFYPQRDPLWRLTFIPAF